MPDDNESRWVSISAAARALGVSRQAIRGRIGRGTLETRREVEGNRERLLVRLPEGIPERRPEPVQERLQEPATDAVALLERHVADLRAEVTFLRAELERRRWRGIVPWLRRAMWG